ncbi:MAG: sialate O-acetylesterase [Acidobacteriota bacterium]|nr:sialate O-acetylesterase [Acidobacteriota bacterium]
MNNSFGSVRLFATSSIACLLSASAFGAVRLPHVLSDHAVLQRDRPIHLWGWATPGAHLAASFHAQTVRGEVDALGHWSLYLKPEQAGGPYVLTVRGDGSEAQVHDVLVGDVWFASGQSNMEMPLKGFPPGAPLKDGEREIAAATHPTLRLLVADHKSSDIPLNDLGGSWTECTPATAQNFSAVAYFFGREIAAREGVPIGLIDSTWGGTPADSWISMDSLGSNPALLPAFASRATFADGQADLEARIQVEQREDAAASAAGRPAPKHPWHPAEASWLPAGLYNGMIAPFTPLTIRGFLWYQGETNSSPDRAPFYGTLFSALIADWRTHFAQGALPFFYAQISSFDSPGEHWGLVRDQQRRTLAIAGTAMAVTLDVGEAANVHPPDKQTVGARLALAARATVYGEDVAYRGPLFREVCNELADDGRAALRVWFDHGKGLAYRGRPASGFEVAGDDHVFVEASARVEGESVLVASPAIKRPVYVRFGWNNVVVDSLYNAAGLPASTFTSEPNAQR